MNWLPRLLAYILGLTTLASADDISFRGLQLMLPQGEKIDKPFRPKPGSRTVSGELIDRKGQRSQLEIRDLAAGPVPGYGVLFDITEDWSTGIGAVWRQSVFLNDIKKGVILVRVTMKGGHRYDLVVTVSDQVELTQWEDYSKKLFPPLKKPGVAESSQQSDKPNKAQK